MYYVSALTRLGFKLPTSHMGSLCSTKGATTSCLKTMDESDVCQKSWKSSRDYYIGGKFPWKCGFSTIFAGVNPLWQAGVWKRQVLRTSLCWLAVLAGCRCFPWRRCRCWIWRMMGTASPPALHEPACHGEHVSSPSSQSMRSVVRALFRDAQFEEASCELDKYLFWLQHNFNFLSIICICALNSSVSTGLECNPSWWLYVAST